MTRLTRHFLTSAVFVLVLAVPAVGAEEEPPPEESPPDDPIVYDIVFPIAGDHSEEYDNFGDPRGSDRTHEGSDIMADKLTPVVAAADGVVVSVRGFDATGAPVPDGHQWLVVDHDGWQTRYLHLNNDSPGTDDGLGAGIAPDLVEAHVQAEATGGDLAHPVAAGQVIGWVGDSGNAEWSGSHLHFEIREGLGWDSVAIDPHPSLIAASPPPDTVEAPNPWNGTFSDDDDSVHEADIETLAADGITKGCNPPTNTMYCPGRLITRGEIAAFIRRTLELPSVTEDFFEDDGETVFEDDINAVTAAGIGFGCTDTAYCANEPLLREEMAEMLVRAFADDGSDRYANPDGTDFFLDDEDSPWEESIDRLMAAGVTKGCNPPDNDRFCPSRPLIRAEMASFFVRALEG